jgi:hypothetical protein
MVSAWWESFSRRGREWANVDGSGVLAGDVGREAEGGGTSATASKVRGSPRSKSCLKYMSGTDDSGGSNLRGSDV